MSKLLSAGVYFIGAVLYGVDIWLAGWPWWGVTLSILAIVWLLFMTTCELVVWSVKRNG